MTEEDGDGPTPYTGGMGEEAEWAGVWGVLAPYTGLLLSVRRMQSIRQRSIDARHSEPAL